MNNACVSVSGVATGPWDCLPAQNSEEEIAGAVAARVEDAEDGLRPEEEETTARRPPEHKEGGQPTASRRSSGLGCHQFTDGEKAEAGGLTLKSCIRALYGGGFSALYLI